ncbi:Stk1 family PASTA domain-containing Ser/Thr kinase [Corynebacterium jeikeium]|uniref:Stk1 family PASTA domain-containing Ser/Thr kinase n=2 Tax=Corynebacterium jeikeium TaxID=38289 RepID=UPI00031E884C|nr:Stk1 family PASTA domain-containing Ser/Thr kinase [Corynebacterium jeikeium]OOD31143.1 serine/threonine protein kinase [Corynebacterium jeikeium]WCZ52591.1 Serine/threonine-protein kinase PknB [Corynebacterium jeikeium]SQI18778.1 serine/threonine protein kinase PknB [Corynebacterium jeikeium]SUY82103.1 serine/threonine protein kinase PknB [Corynebacterium jeikeium]SUY84328.1 serine/threonine protein kinase PknB [Corynebacterium jeikeium]
MDRIGTTLGGRYRLGAKIGTGGMSDVYAATDELLGRDVAVKMMRPDLARDTTFLERFRREAQNAAKLNHPAIVAVYDTGQTPDEDGAVPYIVMERVHGETLRDIIQDSGKMSLNDAAAVMSQVCSALFFSHEAGIIHRDIKPANVMITNTGAVKVMDFGIARALSDSSSAMTQTAAVIGTAQYLSPEQARGQSADARSDIYAAGCVFYELATGKAPFHGESPLSVAFQHVQENPEAPSQVLGMHLSKREALSLDSITLTAMAKSPSDRYDDAQEMATDLKRLSEDQLPLVAQAYANDADSANAGSHTSGRAAAGAAGLAAGAAAAGVAGAHANGDDVQTSVIPASHSTNNGAAAGMAATGGEGGDGYYGEYDDDYEGDDYYDGAYGDEYDDEYGDGYDDEYYEDEPKRRWWAPIAWVAGIAAVIAGGYFAYQAFTGDDEPEKPIEAEQVKIPLVANKDRAEAEKILKDAGFEVTVEETTHDKIARGKAIGTDPAANASVARGTEIKLLVSSGREITDVPDLTGKTTEEAVKLLKDAKLVLNNEVKEEASDDVPKGKIITQTPPQGSQVSAGTKVTITVSTGPEDVRVPVVTGQQVEDARENLESAGFKVVVNQVDSVEPKGQVLSASSEGEKLAKGSEITLEVSLGNQFEMPSLQGMKFGDVFRELQAAGWRGTPDQLHRENKNTADLGRVDEVAQQSIHSGQVIKRDEDITVTVYVFNLLP